jgi:tRNA(Ile)-lysidine synthase
MDRLGPFEPFPALAAAVSGGADSTALAILARDWVRRQNGSLLALVVDHGLRPESAGEARITTERLGRLGIPARLLPLTTLHHGPALAERARTERYQTLSDACQAAGILHLLLGHHAADQAETLAMRVLRGSQTHGLAGMAALRETTTLRLLRPLLSIQPDRLRRLLAGHNVDWVEDPSNRDLRALRPRLRFGLAANAAPPGLSAAPLSDAMSKVGLLRAHEESRIAAELAARATIRPEGFALLSPGPIAAAALGRLVRTIGGAAYAPSPSQLVDLAMQPKAATIGGVRLIECRAGTLVIREEAAIAGPIEVSPGGLWDNRFTCIGSCPNATIGKLGDDAAAVRGISDLPSAVLRTLPAIRVGNKLAMIPHISYARADDEVRVSVLFTPSGPVAGANFMPAGQA